MRTLTQRRESNKPLKPYPSFPLTAHPNGQWAKKSRGRLHYFGPWDNPQAAVERYLAVAADLHAGRAPKVSTNGLTVKDLANEFLNYQAGRFDEGRISTRHFSDCCSLVRDFINHVGKHTAVTDLQALLFREYGTRLAKQGLNGRPWGTYALGRAIGVIRSMFNYGYEAGLLDNPPRFGKSFAKPTAHDFRKAKQARILERGKRLFNVGEIQTILDASTGPAMAPILRHAILLGYKGGSGTPMSPWCPSMPAIRMRVLWS